MKCFYVLLKKWSSAKLSLNRDLSLNKVSLNRDCTVINFLKRRLFFNIYFCPWNSEKNTQLKVSHFSKNVKINSNVLAAKTAKKAEFRNTKSLLLQNWVLRLGTGDFFFYYMKNESRVENLLHKELKLRWQNIPKKLSENARLIGSSEYNFSAAGHFNPSCNPALFNPKFII